MISNIKSNTYSPNFKASFDRTDKKTNRYLNKFLKINPKFALATELAINDINSDDSIVLIKSKKHLFKDVFVLQNTNTKKTTARTFCFQDILPWLCGDMYYDKKLILDNNATLYADNYLKQAEELLKLDVK